MLRPKFTFVDRPNREFCCGKIAGLKLKQKCVCVCVLQVFVIGAAKNDLACVMYAETGVSSLG